MRNKIPDIENMIFSIGHVLLQVLFLRNIKIAILNKGASKTTLKNLVCTILEGRMHYNVFEGKQMWDSDRLSFNAV